MNDTPVSTSTLRWAVRLIALQALAIFVLACIVTWISITASHVSSDAAVATPLITFLAAAIFGGLALALHQLRGWARGPAIVLEMLLVPMGWIALPGILPLGIALVVTGFANTVLLLAPSTRAALGLDRYGPGTREADTTEPDRKASGGDQSGDQGGGSSATSRGGNKGGNKGGNRGGNKSRNQGGGKRR